MIVLELATEFKVGFGNAGHERTSAHEEQKRPDAIGQVSLAISVCLAYLSFAPTPVALGSLGC